MLQYRSDLKSKARLLRRGMTDAERLLWSRLRRKQILGVQFYRQKPIGSYIVDFYAPKANLVIEVDGAQHYEEPGFRSDRNRDQQLARLGLQVMRFDNLQVLNETEAVVQSVCAAILRNTTATPRTAIGPGETNPPVPPFFKGGSGGI